MNERGFTLIEVLISILIMSVAVVTFMGVISQVLFFTKRAEKTTQSIIQMENILYQLETGMRSDLVSYGGRERLDEDTVVRIQSEAALERLQVLELALSVKENEELTIQTYILEGGI